MEFTEVFAPRAISRPEPDSVPDRDLLNRFQRGDREAASRLYERYAERLRALTRRKSSTVLACRLDPDDIVQSVFRNFFHAAREGGYDVPPGEDLWKLLLVIALNKIRARGTFHRAAKRDVRRTRRIDAERQERVLAQAESLHQNRQPRADLGAADGRNRDRLAVGGAGDAQTRLVGIQGA